MTIRRSSVAAASTLFAMLIAAALVSATPEYKMTGKQQFREYTVITYYDDQTGEGRIEILKAGKRVYQQSPGGRFEIGTRLVEDDVANTLTKMGKDIAGDGTPDLVISEWTGGAHCCSNFYVFEIGAGFRLLAKIEAGHGDGSHFADLDGDHNLEFVAADWTFAYWHTSFAESPTPEIILRFTAGKYRLAEDQMRKPAPSEAEMRETIQWVQSNESWEKHNPPPILWGEMLNLIYTGHSDIAWRFLDQAWPAKEPGKTEFLSDFRAQLAKSPYWLQIQHLNLSR
jgi:hypothetical protein